ncbi:MAG: hypothetical protein NTV62_03910 [Candidatus Gribaldobacteria bacterium]|nr:hypothetical protein [Candidatus Gribaldobacteria bacterium]
MPRPKQWNEIGGVKYGELLKIQERIPKTTFETKARYGSGGGIYVTDVFKLLKWVDDKILDRVKEKYGEFGPEGLLCVFRDWEAPNTFETPDPPMGVGENLDVFANALPELAEIGLYNKDFGWVGFDLYEDLTPWNSLVTREQEKIWNRLHHGFPCYYYLRIKSNSNLGDRINGQPVILTTEPGAGSCEIMMLAVIDCELLPQKTNLLIRDTEFRGDGPCDRKPIVICPRKGKSPLMFFFGPDGPDIKSKIVILGGENLTSCNNKIRTLLQALAWI